MWRIQTALYSIFAPYLLGFERLFLQGGGLEILLILKLETLPMRGHVATSLETIQIDLQHLGTQPEI